MEISKSTPYVRYRENISSTLHKGTIHIESEYLDRERKTTIESIEGQTWQNMVNGENKEEDVLPRLGLKIEGNEDVFDSVEQHMPIDTIIGDVEPVANEDGTYTYEISTMEGSYAKTLDGENNFSLTSDGLVGDMYIKYNAQGEEVNGNIVMNNYQSNYTIENSNNGEIKSAILKGQTLVSLTKAVFGNGRINKQYANIASIKIELLKPSTKYIAYVFNDGEEDVELYWNNSANFQWKTFVCKSKAMSYSIGTSKANFNDNELVFSVQTTQTLPQSLRCVIIEYQEGMENWDIPYFEGMQSVKMPVLTTTNYNNLANNTTIEYGYISGDSISVQKKWLISGFISIEPNVTYTVRSKGVTNDGVFVFAFYDESKKFIVKRTSKNETSPTNAKFVRINVRRNNGNDLTENEKNGTILYLEKTTEVLPFESHKTNTLTTPEDVTLRAVGDVRDELDCLTGEVTQRIGEVILDGSEDWSYGAGNTNETIALFYMKLDDISKRKLSINDKLPSIEGYSVDFGEGVYVDSDINIRIAREKLNNEITRNSFKQWLSQNPITVQYQLTTPTITQVDLTIKDQDDKIIQSLHTHPSTTHINLSSDGLIPSAELSYTMYGNIGETTGEKITDGVDSKLIEGKIYGDTLLNVLPSPSLKNSMDYNTSMQKLNNGYDNINVVDGEFKKATLYGQTLVNLVNSTHFVANGCTNPSHNGDGLYTADKGDWFGFGFATPTTIGQKYIFHIKSAITTNGNIYVRENSLQGNQITSFNTNSVKYVVFTATTDITHFGFGGASLSNPTINTPILMYYQDGIENWDWDGIPYFEGMQSVVMPSLMTFNTCNIFNPNNVEYSGDDCFSLDYYPVTVGTKLSTTTLSKASIWTHLNLYDENKNIVKYLFGNSQAVEKTFVISDPNVKFVRFKCLKARANETILNYGDVRPYEPYQPLESNTLTTPEDVILRAVGDVRDELDCLTGEVTQIFGEVGITGDENFENFMTGGSCIKCTFISPKYISGNSALLCDKLPINNTLWGDSNTEGIRYYDSKIHIAIDKTKLESYDTTGISNYIKSIGGINLIYKEPTPIVKTVNLSITNQDNQPQTALNSIANGYINTSSQGLLPKVDYEVPTSNSYYLDMVKPNTQYTTKSSSDCNATIDGTSYPLSANGTFTTPSTITNKTMVLDAPVNDLMFIEGDLTGRELDYFTGLQSVDMPVLTTTGKNLFDGVLSQGYIGDESGNPNTSNGGVYSPNYIRVNPSTTYICSWKTKPSSSVFKAYFYDENKEFLKQTKQSNVFTAPDDCYYIRFRFYGGSPIPSSFENIQIEEGNTATSFESYKSNILTVNEDVELHGIGDVKDELDLVNECVVGRIGTATFNGSENWEVHNYGYKIDTKNLNLKHNTPSDTVATNFMCDRIPTSSINDLRDRGVDAIAPTNENDTKILVYVSSVGKNNLNGFKQWLSENPITVLYELATPTTEPVRIVPQNHRQSTTSLTLQSPLQKVGNVADQLRWNPYKGHYVRYNYIQDGVANSTYTFEDLKDMNERKFVNLYNQRTYIDTDHTVQVISHGLSRYCLAEQGKQYQVRWDWIEQPSVDTIKVDLCGNVKEIPSTDNSVVIDVEKFTHQFVQIQGLGLTGKITNLMVIETIDGEIPDVDFFSGIQCVGNVVQVDGVNKAEIVVEQTNGNLLDVDFIINSNGNNIDMAETPLLTRPNKNYIIKFDNSIKRYYFVKDSNKNSLINDGLANNETLMKIPYNGYYFRCYAIVTSNGSANVHYPIELCYADMAKDGIRPRYYDKESIILPMKLCRVGNIYDNLYYDDLKGYYRIQQSIGHKYFTGETTEVWTMETTNGYRTIKFTCTSANIDQIALGQTICNSFKHLSTINDDIEGFIIYNGNFVLRIDKDRLTDKTVDGFKALLASSPIHLFYQMKTPQMINLTEYPNRIELNTYRDEIFTFFKGMNPTKFTLSVPMDKTYRYEIEEEGQGLANRVTVNNETISAENVVAVKEVRGQGIANIIEDVNNIVITPRPNYGGKSTSHTLNNTKPATIRIHGFEPSGETAIGTYNTTDKAYQLKVMSSNGDNSLSDYYVLNVPYKLETYADGTKDMVYYDEAYKQWHFKGSSVKEYTVASDGTLSEIVEVFRGLAPRSGMIAEFKLMFTSGTTSSRMYYSLNGTTYNYTSLRNMSDGNYLYVGLFNTGGTKIDIAYKTDPNAEYTNLSPLSTQVPECLMINQIQSCTFCEVTLDKQYIYSEMNTPIELDTYDGTTKVFMDGNATDTNIIIRNEGTTKIVNTYTDTDYTVYWKYVDGLGNLRITLGGTTVEVDGKQEYATIKTQLNAPQELLYVGGYNLSIKDLMVVKGAKIDDLPYFEGSRQVGTLVLDEEGNKSYKITLVQGGSVLEQRDEDTIAFKDDNKHNVVVHKIVGVCPTKVD